MMIKRVLLLAVATALAPPTAAWALTFAWSWTPNFNQSHDLTLFPGNTVKGTISGLHDGSNDETGVTVDVTQADSATVLGTDWIFSDAPTGDAFAVSGGSVVASGARFDGGTGTKDLYFCRGGQNSYDPAIADYLVTVSLLSTCPQPIPSSP